MPPVSPAASLCPGGEAVPATRPFDIEIAIPLLREAVRPYPPAVLFKLYDDGHTSVFEILIACIVSIRTREEVTLPVAQRLFAAARTPEAVVALGPEGIAALIAPCAFASAKAGQIAAIAAHAVAEYGGVLPCDSAVLTSFVGVGPKCANLALGIACGQPRIGVDIHVHRVTNRWGYVQARTPEATMDALEKRLPEAYWVEINRLLVPFGRAICTGSDPRCSICPLLDMCEQVGVTTHR